MEFLTEYILLYHPINLPTFQHNASYFQFHSNKFRSFKPFLLQLPIFSILQTERVYPKRNGIITLNRNARTILIDPINAELLNVSLLKTISPIIKTITSKIDHALKYPTPYTKHILNNTAKIRADSINASLLFPFAYQQTKANNGETAVNPNQIIA